MNKTFKTTALYLACLLGCSLPQARAQGIHFSQYYNAPMLVNPANTALMPESDYRLGANYRNQWAAVPVPYKTFSAYGDFQVARSPMGTNWLGLGGAVFSDKAGAGELSLTRVELMAAYHLQMGEYSMISAGLSGGYVQRSVDFTKLSFDMQWDGTSFNTNLSSGENRGLAKTTYMDVAAGINYAYFPNDNVYIKAGVGLAHVNRPRESFYSMDNQLAMRPTLNVDALFRLGNSSILNPSVYYTSQRKASELVFGSLMNIYINGEGRNSNQLILGAFHRLNESVIAAVGIDWGPLRIMSSYDFTVSNLAKNNRSQGAFEVAVRYLGVYGQGGRARSLYNCPRF